MVNSVRRSCNMQRGKHEAPIRWRHQRLTQVRACGCCRRTVRAGRACAGCWRQKTAVWMATSSPTPGSRGASAISTPNFRHSGPRSLGAELSPVAHGRGQRSDSSSGKPRRRPAVRFLSICYLQFILKCRIKERARSV